MEEPAPADYAQLMSADTDPIRSAAADAVAWLLTGYLLSAAICTPILGRVGDMLGKEKVLVAVLALLSVGTLVSALATTLPIMLVGRVIQGAGGAVFPLSFGIIP